MKYNNKTIKKIQQDCNLCRGNFLVWLTTLNFDREQEENVKKHLYNHCPNCKLFDKLKNKEV